MIWILVQGGPYMFPLLGLAIVIVVLTAKKSFDLFLSGEPDPRELKPGLDALLFWGCISAVLGVLGQLHGHYLSLKVIIDAEMVSPRLVAEGLAVALIATLFGLGQFAFAALAWFALSCRYRVLLGRTERGRSGGA